MLEQNHQNNLDQVIKLIDEIYQLQALVDSEWDRKKLRKYRRTLTNAKRKYKMLAFTISQYINKQERANSIEYYF